MSEWQPIETAPKDGTVIDLWSRRFEKRSVDCRWVVENRQLGTHCVMDGWKSPGMDRHTCLNPAQFTHWMPLPTPPKP